MADIVIPFLLSSGPCLNHSAFPGQATSQSLGLSVPLKLEKEQRENTRQWEESLDPKVMNEEEVQDSMAGALGSVEGHSQTAMGNSPVTWFSPALRQP